MTSEAEWIVNAQPDETYLAARGSIDPAAGLRAALRCLAKPVVVITARHQGQRYAMTAMAVSELSMDPPSMLVCINQTASRHTPLRLKSAFCFNFLEISHERIARRSGGAVKGEARFEEAGWRDDDNGLPCLVGAQASIACTNDAAVQYGTHCIFIGRVISVGGRHAADPLFYSDDRFGSVGS